MPANLSRELARHPRFRWEPGMLAKGRGYRGWAPRCWVDTTERLTTGGPPHLDHAHPDLADAATAGVLLDEVYRLHTATVVDRAETGDTPWCVELLAVGPDARDLPFRGATLGEAAARALLAWWGPP